MNPQWQHVFPFCAVIGQDAVKNALIWNAVNPRIGGVLISGEKGTAKSTLARGLAAVLGGTEVVELPLNVTEDRLVGTIDLEKAIIGGKKCLEPGILQKADGNILYADEVNLLSDHIVNCLLEVSASGVNLVEREGVSCSHRARFVLVGTMNPEEGALDPQFLDRFGLCVQAGGSRLPAERAEIIRRRLAYEKAPDAYIAKWKDETEKLSEKIARAKEILGRVEVSESVMRLAAQIAAQGNCAGHRAELAAVQTARAVAALAARTDVSAEDLKLAAGFALPHRLRRDPRQKPPENGEEARGGAENSPPEQAAREPGTRPERGPGETEAQRRENASAGETRPGAAPDAPEKLEEPGAPFAIKPLPVPDVRKKVRKTAGKRSLAGAGPAQGRYIRHALPKGRPRDIAFDATLRAAAPHQSSREPNGMAIVIESADLREKMRQRRTGRAILFIVDASGSMGVRQRMKAVKAAILSILNDAYQKRDQVGMIAFRKQGAEELLGITRSVELAEKQLRRLPTGGRTPLAGGLAAGYEALRTAARKNPDLIPLIVLISDGRANVSLRGGDPVEEALQMADAIRSAGIGALVIDTEKGFMKLSLARKIAGAMGAEYLKLEDLEEERVETEVKRFAAKFPPA